MAQNQHMDMEQLNLNGHQNNQQIIQSNRSLISSDKISSESVQAVIDTEPKGTAETTYKNHFCARSLGQKKRWSALRNKKQAQTDEIFDDESDSKQNKQQKVQGRMQTRGKVISFVRTKRKYVFKNKVGCQKHNFQQKIVLKPELLQQTNCRTLSRCQSSSSSSSHSSSKNLKQQYIQKVNDKYEKIQPDLQRIKSNLNKQIVESEKIVKQVDLGAKQFDFRQLNLISEQRNMQILDLPNGIQRLKQQIIYLKGITFDQKSDIAKTDTRMLQMDLDHKHNEFRLNLMKDQLIDLQNQKNNGVILQQLQIGQKVENHSNREFKDLMEERQDIKQNLESQRNVIEQQNSQMSKLKRILETQNEFIIANDLLIQD